MEITQLYIYPIKSLSGIRLSGSEIEPRGLKYDRRWVIVDQNNIFLTQRTCSQLGNFKVEMESDGLIVWYKPDNSFLKVPFDKTDNNFLKIKVWDDEVDVNVYPDEINNWLSEKIGEKVKLCYQNEESIRAIDQKFLVNGNEHTSLSDGYPILIISEESIELLNNNTEEKIEIERFRPNIVFKGGKAHLEDELKEFRINDALFYGVKPCARCIFTTINPDTLEKGKEPLFTLSKYRKVGNKILFGQNVLVHQTGFIKVGDKIETS